MQIATFAHESIRHMVIYFLRYWITAAKHADTVVPIKYLRKYITRCLMLSYVNEAVYMDKITFLYFTYTFQRK